MAEELRLSFRVVETALYVDVEPGGATLHILAPREVLAPSHWSFELACPQCRGVLYYYEHETEGATVRCQGLILPHEIHSHRCQEFLPLRDNFVPVSGRVFHQDGHPLARLPELLEVLTEHHWSPLEQVLLFAPVPEEVGERLEAIQRLRARVEEASLRRQRLRERRAKRRLAKLLERADLSYRL